MSLSAPRLQLQMSGVHVHDEQRTCTTRNEHVGTSTASAGRMPDGGAEQRQRRRGEDGPSLQKRALKAALVVWRALYEQNCESVYLRNGHGRAPV